MGWQSMLGAVEEVRTLAAAGRRLQLHHTGRPFDHRPVQLTAFVQLDHQQRRDRTERPNQEAMHYALQTGHMRQEFFAAAHHRLENAYLDLHLLAYRGDVEGVTTRTFEIFNAAAMEVLTRT
eukprot:5993281-Pyramimonas_sp.AAC.1